MLKFLKVITNIVVLALFILITFFILSPFFGLKLYAVVSGSMEPGIPVGALAAARTVPAEEIIAGDVITFYVNPGSDTVATHRVVEVNKAEGSFKTKGDNNEAADINPVKYSQLLGRVQFSLPYLGYFYYFLGTMIGKITMIIVFLSLITLTVLLEKFLERRD